MSDDTDPTTPPDTGRCGTYAGYQRHRRRRQEPCQPCREANNAEARDRYRADPSPRRIERLARQRAYVALSHRHPNEFRALYEAERRLANDAIRGH